MNINEITEKYLNESPKAFYVYKKVKGSKGEWSKIYKPKFSKLETAWKKARKWNQDDKQINGTGREYEYAASTDMRSPARETYLNEKMKLKLKKGAFHKWLGKDEDEPITTTDIQKGLNSDDAHVRKMAQFAKNAKGWKH